MDLRVATYGRVSLPFSLTGKSNRLELRRTI